MSLTYYLEDYHTHLEFRAEVPATLFDLPAEAVLMRVYVEANTRSQNLKVSLVYEDDSTLILTTTFNTNTQAVGEWSVSSHRRWVAVRVEHTGAGLTDIVEVFAVEIDVYVPTVILEETTDPGDK